MDLLLATLLLALAPTDTIRVDASHWRVYDSQGNPSSLEAIVRTAGGADALLIGETHDDPVVHALQLELLQRVFTAYHDRGVALSMEMFTRDVQMVVDEYLDGIITESAFRAASLPWPNYATDYRPMVEFAKAHGLPVIAANAPRRYVNRVTRLGPQSLDALSAEALRHVAPLPYAKASEAYAAEWNALMAEAMAGMAAARPTPDSTSRGNAAPSPQPTAAPSGQGPQHGGMSYMLDSQSLWDATMAWSIAEHQMRNPGSLVVHVVGAFHVENYTGIPEHLVRYRPGSGQVVVTVRPAADVNRFDPAKHAGLGDFVILADESLPRTHRR